MCGLISIVTKAKMGFMTGEVRAFSDALYIDALRGEDATGIISYSNTGAGRILKECSPSYEFLKKPEVKIALNSAITNGVALIGHNRKKTVGSDSDANAHPFVIDNRYAFVHNGTLLNHKDIGDHEVDSESLAHHLTKCDGDKEKIEEALNKVRGAYSCIWIDFKSNKMYWVRNADRPLWMSTIPQGFVLSSEPTIMTTALIRNGITPTETQFVEPLCLYSFGLFDSSAVVHKEVLTVKKSLPPVIVGGQNLLTTSTTVVSPISSIKTSSNEVSKNGFKNMRRRLINKPITFWLEDYIEKHYPAITTDWLVFGSSEIFADRNINIHGELTGVTKYAIADDWENALCSAIVEDVIYDKEKKTFSVQVKDIKRVPKSIVLQ